MSADLLRRAAALMRERAEADGSRGWRVEDGNEGITYSPLWMVANDAFHNPPENDDEPWLAVEIHTGTKATAHHIASWHPDVALAVADWLYRTAEKLADHEARFEDKAAWPRFREHVYGDAINTARAYLGETP